MATGVYTASPVGISAWLGLSRSSSWPLPRCIHAITVTCQSCPPMCLSPAQKEVPFSARTTRGPQSRAACLCQGHTDTKLPSRALGRHSREACLVLRMAIGTDPGAGSWLVAPGLSVDSHMTAEARSLASSGRHLLLHLHTCQYYIWGFPHPILDTAHGGPP